MVAALRWLLNFLLLARELFAIVAVFDAESRLLFYDLCSSVRLSVCPSICLVFDFLFEVFRRHSVPQERKVTITAKR